MKKRTDGYADFQTDFDLVRTCIEEAAFQNGVWHQRGRGRRYLEEKSARNERNRKREEKRFKVVDVNGHAKLTF